MPNWCHNTLTVEGTPDDVRAFALAVQRGDDAPEGATPLTFREHAPEPSADVYAAMDEAAKVTCDLCGGVGYRPTTQEEADARGVRFHDNPYTQSLLELAVQPKCNGCAGEGRRIEKESWYTWRLENWGTKWDASFSGPFMALAAGPAADVAKSEASEGVILAPGLAIYRFDTAWSPPMQWLARAAEACRTLTFTLRYGEPGNDFAGEAKVKGTRGRHVELPVDEVLAPEDMWY
jgi:hypothetical protein